MAFVFANGSEQAETATLLLALAEEKGIDPWTIRVVWDGFEVPDELLSVEDRSVIEKAPAETAEAPDEEEPKPAPKRRGRPPGTKNKMHADEEAPVEAPEADESDPDDTDKG